MRKKSFRQMGRRKAAIQTQEHSGTNALVRNRREGPFNQQLEIILKCGLIGGFKSVKTKRSEGGR